MPSQCTGRNKAGLPCSAQVWKDGLCRWHHPALEAQRMEERRRGGQARSNAARAAKAMPGVMSHDQVLATVGNALTSVFAGDLEPGVANAVANLARSWVAVNEAGALARIEERVLELERVAHSRGRFA